LEVIDFPTAPSVGQTHLAAGLVWRFDGQKWQAATAPVAPPLPAGTLVVAVSTALSAGFNGTVMVMAAAPLTVTLPPAPAVGQQVTVKDAQGAAGTHPITVAGPIEGATNMVIGFNYGWVALQYSGSQWVQT
jgi:hypothetical protein